jgi:hypothetical protein
MGKSRVPRQRQLREPFQPFDIIAENPQLRHGGLDEERLPKTARHKDGG